jgi:hypothetical protein
MLRHHPINVPQFVKISYLIAGGALVLSGVPLMLVVAVLLSLAGVLWASNVAAKADAKRVADESRWLEESMRQGQLIFGELSEYRKTTTAGPGGASTTEIVITYVFVDPDGNLIQSNSFTWNERRINFVPKGNKAGVAVLYFSPDNYRLL